jgi:hypothetical protein
VAPPEVPPDRLEALRAAFVETAGDSAFVNEITARGGSVELMTGTDLQDLIAKLYRSPPEVIAAVKEALGQ